MFGLNRRGVLTGLAYAMARPTTAGSKASPSFANAGPAGPYTSVMAFGAKGDGVTDDTRAIRAAQAATPLGGTVWFPPGTYVVSRIIVLKPGTTYRGSNPQSSVIKQADGANLRAVVADENFIMNSLQPCSGVQIEDLGIDGNAAANPAGGHGLVLMTERCLVRHVIVSYPRQAGIVLTDKNARGTILGQGNNAVENRIEDCTIIQPGKYGVWVRDSKSSGRQTDGYLLNNVVKNTRGAWAMRIERAAGWIIANNHVYHCSGSGFYLSHVAGTYFYCNEVDKFGFSGSSSPNSFYGVKAEFFMGRFRPSIFLGNVCATPEGMYPRNLYTYYALGGDQYGESNLVLIGNVCHNDPVGEPPKAHHAYESTAFTYTTQPGGALHVAMVANTNAGALTYQYIGKGSDVTLDAAGAAARAPITTALAAGVTGGAVVGGVGLAARSRLAREQLAKVLGSNQVPAVDSGTEQKPMINVVETLSRWEIDLLDIEPDVGSLYLTYFVPFQQTDVTRVTSATRDRPAAGAAVSRVGIYEVLETGGLRLIAASSSATADLWVIPHSVATVDLDPESGPLPLKLLAGKAYAYAEIQSGGSSATRVGKTGNPGLMAMEPRASATYKGYDDLPPTLPPPSEANISGVQFYARLTGAGNAGADPEELAERG